MRMPAGPSTVKVACWASAMCTGAKALHAAVEIHRRSDCDETPSSSAVSVSGIPWAVPCAAYRAACARSERGVPRSGPLRKAVASCARSRVPMRRSVDGLLRDRGLGRTLERRHDGRRRGGAILSGRVCNGGPSHHFVAQVARGDDSKTGCCPSRVGSVGRPRNAERWLGSQSQTHPSPVTPLRVSNIASAYSGLSKATARVIEVTFSLFPHCA